MAADNGALAAYPLAAVEALRVAGPVVRGLILDHGLIIGPTEEEPPAPMQPTMLVEVATEFEFWLLERWLAAIRSPGWRDSPAGKKMRARWERER